MLEPTAAEKLIASHLICLPIESLPLGQCGGAVLRENIYAERDQPPFDRVMMDGVALSATAAASGLRRYRIQGTQAAGEPPLSLSSQSHCIEVMTGAVLPVGCDSVVPVEQTSPRDGLIELSEAARPLPWSMSRGAAAIGRRVRCCCRLAVCCMPPEVAVAASPVLAHIRVSSQPAIMVVSTGNELVEPGDPIAPHQIRRSNAYGVATALRQRGFRRVADDHLPDDRLALQERLRLHMDTHEVLVLSGGVSMGRFDLVPEVLASLGVQCVLHGIAQRPGKPMWFGTSTEGHAVFALPGNPVSTLVCLIRYVVPALYGAMGRPEAHPERVALASSVAWQSPLTGFMPVRLSYDEWARPWATPCPTNTSGDFSALALTDGFVELPPGPADLGKGHVTRLFRW